MDSEMDRSSYNFISTIKWIINLFIWNRNMITLMLYFNAK
jgi:hypothetical protein